MKKILVLILLSVFILASVVIVGAQVDSDSDGIPDDVDACYNPNAPAGLVSYWGLNDGSGTTAADSYDGNLGTLINGPAWTTGQVGGALNFDGIDDYVDCGNAANLQLTTGTVCAWIKTSSAGGDYRRIVIKQWAYGMFLKSNVFGIYDWRRGTFHSTGINLADGEWHHVSFTFQNNVSGGTVLYVDGASVLMTTMTIGNQNYPVTISCSTLPFTGLIDEVAIYDRALDAGEIADHYNNGLAGKGYCEVLDSDGDGIADGVDNCPTVANPDQADIDKDGLGDACDCDADGLCTARDYCIAQGTPDPNCCTDADGDGYAIEGGACGPVDCNDADPSIHPGATEVCDRKDNDCDGIVPADEIDNDADGMTECEGDCDDTNAAIYPGATEICDGLDNDCDAMVDEGYPDTDNDGMADCVDPDDDNDKILDSQDNCPLTPNPGQEDNEGDGIGDVCDPDDDNDGVLDSDDLCPFQDATGLDADGDGCIDRVEDMPTVIEELALPQGIETALVSTVDNAMKSLEKGNEGAAINQLQAFINKVKAQRGKKISEEAADMLIEYANNVIAQIEAG